MTSFFNLTENLKYLKNNNLRGCWIQQIRNGNKAAPNPYATNNRCHHKLGISSAERPHNGFVPANFDIISLYLSSLSDFIGSVFDNGKIRFEGNKRWIFPDCCWTDRYIFFYMKTWKCTQKTQTETSSRANRNFLSEFYNVIEKSRENTAFFKKQLHLLRRAGGDGWRLLMVIMTWSYFETLEVELSLNLIFKSTAK